MIPPYRLRHRPVPIARTWYSFGPRPRRPLKLGGRPGSDRCGVCVDIERGLLGIRFGRGRMVTVLQTSRPSTSPGPGAAPRCVHARSRRDGYLRFGAPTGGGAGPVPPAGTDDPCDRPGRPAGAGVIMA